MWLHTYDLLQPLLNLKKKKSIEETQIPIL